MRLKMNLNEVKISKMSIKDLDTIKNILEDEFDNFWNYNILSSELKNLYEYANETEGIMIKTDKDRFVYIFEYKYLEKIKESKFAILDTIKEVLNLKNLIFQI